MKIIKILLFTTLLFNSLFAVGSDKFKLIAVSKEPLQAGKKAEITIFLSDAETKAPITEAQLKTVHTKKLHALIIDPSLTDYHHQHPVPGKKPGEYTFTFTPETSYNYRIWLDITPVDSQQVYIMSDLTGKNTNNPPVKKLLSTHSEVDQYKFDLTFDKNPLRQDQAVMGNIMIKDKNNKPYTQLEPIMGAFAHIVAFSEDYKTILHVHPMGKEPQTSNERGGPEIDFHITPTTKGYVKIFAQTLMDGHEVFAPFGVNVE